MLNICMDNQTQSQLTIDDLNSIKIIIERACTEGIFQAPEMRTVGEIYERLDAFLSSLDQNMPSTNQPQGEKL
jgi:hypothetical protein